MNTPHVDHILGAYMRSSTADRADGTDWYASARTLAQTLLPDDVETAAGVIAALSPMTAWPENVKRATAAIRGEHVAHTEPNVAKVLRILSGEYPLDVLSGPKTRAFFLNIMGEHSIETVTVDRHAIDVACGIVQSDTDRAKAIRGKAGYAKVAAMYVEAANIIGDITPAQLQAVVWVYWRRNVVPNFHGDV
jgi:hypothetical protein